MSNMVASPGSRPLEQLKVAELRDELRKRGLTLKGVKKELFERLEEAIKKEEQEGIVYGEHQATEERPHNMGTSDDNEDLEGEEETLVESTDEACKTHNATVALETPVPTSEHSAPSSDGMHALPGVIAPHEVAGSTEDREGVSSAAGADVGFNNNVLLADNAVRENGDAMIQCESVGKEAGVLEPSGHVECVNREEEPAMVTPDVAKSERSDTVGDTMCVNKETEPAIVTPDLANSERSDPVGDNMFVNKEMEPALVTHDLAKSERSDDVEENVLASSVIGDVISDVAGISVDNVDPYVAINSTVSTKVASENLSAHDANRSNAVVHNVKNDVLNAILTEDQLSKPETPLEKSFTEADKCLVQPMMQQSDSSEPVDMPHVEEVGLKMESSFVSSSQSVACQEVNEPSAGLKSEDLEGHNISEMDFTTTEEKPDVKVKQLVKNETTSAGGLLNSDVKVELMEIETGLENKQEVTYAVKMESQTDGEDHAQLSQVKEEVSDLANSLEGMGKESVHRVQADWMKDGDNDVKLRPMEDASQARINLKRKDDERDTIQQEPAKRMRRWNSGKEAVVDGLKPLTTDSMKEIMLPDGLESFSPSAQRLTPRAVATSRSITPKVKVEPDPSSNIRTVPPSTRAPSNSIKVERFVRPFTLKAAKDLVAVYGQCVDFWMDQIKTHCFVTYSSVNEAVAARNGLYGRQWPPSGNCLVADFVDAKEVKMRSEGLMENAQTAPTASLMRVSNSTQMPPPPRVVQSSPPIRNESIALSSPRFSRDAQLPPISRKDPEPPVVTLEDLFYKTKTKPHIYYLPLTDEQVAEKLKNKQAVR